MISPKTTTITLLIAVLAVVAAVATSGRTNRASGANGVEPLLPAAQLPSERVSRIALSRRDGEECVFERTAPAQWMQVRPFEYPLLPGAIESILTAAHETRIVDRLGPNDFDEELTLATLGLDPPEATLTLHTDAGTHTIAFGRRGIAGRAYARMNGQDDVLIVSQDLHQLAVEVDPKEWRDRRLFQNVSVDCDRIVRQDGSTRLVLERDRGTWRMIEPVQTRVDRDGFERFIQAIGGAHSAGFIADDPAEESLKRFGLGPDASAASVSVLCSRVEAVNDDVVRVEHEQRLHIGNPAGAGTQDRFGIMQGRPTVVRLPLKVLQGLFSSTAELIDPTGSGAIPADVKSIRIMSDAGEMRLERNLDRWIAPLQGEREVQPTLVDDFLATLTELRAPAVEIRDYPHELQRAVITLYGFDDRPIDTVRILHHDATGQWALENGDTVLRVFRTGFEIALTPSDFGVE